MTEPAEVHPARAAAIMAAAAAETAATAQQHMPDPTQEDFRAHGRELLRALRAWTTLSTVLAEQVISDTAAAGPRRDAALEHLGELHVALQTACAAAEAYRADLFHLAVDDAANTPPDPE